jgi:HlyD family secretion protein
MRKVKTYAVVSCILLFIGAGCQQSNTPPVYSGIIEGKEFAIQSELGGMIETMSLEEGQAVQQHQTVAKLVADEYKLRVTEAKAAVDAAQAKWEEARSGSRGEKIQEAAAKVEQAQALTAQAAAKAQAVATQISVLEANKMQLENKKQGAKQTLAYQQDRLQKAQALWKAGALSENEVNALQEAVNQAQTTVNDIEKQMHTIDAQIAQARQEEAASMAAQTSFSAGTKAAQANLDLLRAGDTLRNLLAQKEAADSKLAQARLLLSKTFIRSPENGVILRKHAEKGEVIKPGTTLYTLLKRDDLEVVVYVPEAALNQVQTGQKAAITVDAYPKRTFSGVVTRIANQAEFTPKNVQTPDERTKMVFAVTIKVTDGLQELKPGMPADIVLLPRKAGEKK